MSSKRGAVAGNTWSQHSNCFRNCPIPFLLDIIGDSVYSEYAELRQIKKQTSRIFSCDRLNAARVRELGAHVRGRLRTHVSPCPYLRGQSTPARRWWWSERDALQLCR